MNIDIPETFALRESFRGASCQLPIRVACNKSTGTERVAYRVRTTTPHRYSVTPKSGVLELAAAQCSPDTLEATITVDVVLRTSITHPCDGRTIDRFEVSVASWRNGSVEESKCDLKEIVWKNGVSSAAGLVWLPATNCSPPASEPPQPPSSTGQEHVAAKKQILKDLIAKVNSRRDELEQFEMGANQRESSLVGEDAGHQYRFALPGWTMVLLFAITLAFAAKFRPP
jgi:hypothetical protein